MITIARNGHHIQVTFNVGLATSVNAWGDCDKDLYADAVTRRVAEAVCAAMCEIRQRAYNDGWRDAKSKKRAKKTWFSGELP